jgi:MBG domain (YGX type)/Right handed beta helix region
MSHNLAEEWWGGRGTVAGRRRLRQRMKPTLMALEERSLLSTIVVNNPTDTPIDGETDLRQAIVQANTTGGDQTINFDPAVFDTPQTITLSGSALGLADTTGTETITGPAAGVTVSGGGLSGVFQVGANVTASISGLTITGGMITGYGGGLYSQGTITLTNCSISGNSANTNGGGIFALGEGATILNNCLVSGNVSEDGFGGGIFSDEKALTLNDCTVSNNTGIQGGGVHEVYSTTTLTNCIVSGNTAGTGFAGGAGGGLSFNGGSAALTGCNISGNAASDEGGGLFAFAVNLSLTNCAVTGNSSSTRSGGGVSAEADSSLTLTGCTISGNTSGLEGGGLAQDEGSLSLTDCTVSDNTALAAGGLSLEFASTPTTLTNCVVSGNTATGFGGGGLITYEMSTVLTNCTVSGNTTSVSGGGMYTINRRAPDGGTNSTDMLTNCTFSGNIAGQSGGGVGTVGYVQSQFSDCTISGNTANQSGGGLFIAPYQGYLATLEIGNTIVAGNAAAASGPDASGTLVSQGNNLIGETDGSAGWISTDLTGTGAQPLNPLLAPLRNYGGTSQTMALLPGSPAIDAGNNSLIPAGVATDQRGLSRTINGVVDIGAFESQGFTLTPVSGSTPQSTLVGHAFANALAVTVTADDSLEPVAGGVITFIAPTSGVSANLSSDTATIGTNNQASILATADSAAGNYVVTASATGVATTAAFLLTNNSNQPTVTVSDAGGIYKGSAFAASATITPNDGPPGDTLEGVGITFTYYVGTGTSGTNLGSTAPSNAGNYTVVADFPGSTDFSSASDSTSFTIAKANATVVVTPYTVTYDGKPHTATIASITGVNGETGATVGTVTLNTTHTSAGTYASDYWSFTGAANYNNLASTTITDTINKAALTITADNESKTFGTNLTFAGTEFTPSGLFTGDSVNSVTLTSAGAAATAAVGTYPVTPSNAVGTGLGNYMISYANGTMTVTALNWSTNGDIYVLDPKASGALTLSGAATINVTGNVIVDSSSSSAITVSGSASVKAAGTQVVGGVQKSGNPSFNPQPVTGSQVISDPLAGLGVPTYSGTPISEVLSGSSTATINPGVYSQITVSGSAKLTMKAGTYVIEGGGFTVSGSGGVSGTGVMIYNTDSSAGTFGAITVSGAGTVALSAPSSGPDAGILIFQDRSNTHPLTFSGSGALGIAGAIYAAAAELVESGAARVGSTSNPVSLVIDTINLSGSATANTATLATPVGTTASLSVAPPSATISAGTLATTVKAGTAIRRTPARFAFSPLFVAREKWVSVSGAKKWVSETGGKLWTRAVG